MVGKAQLDGLSSLFLLLSMESIGLPHLQVIRATTSQIPCHLLQFEGSPQVDGGPLVGRLRAHFCEFTIYSWEPESGQMPEDLLPVTEHSIYICLHSEGHRLNRLPP